MRSPFTHRRQARTFEARTSLLAAITAIPALGCAGMRPRLPAAHDSVSGGIVPGATLARTCQNRIIRLADTTDRFAKSFFAISKAGSEVAAWAGVRRTTAFAAGQPSPAALHGISRPSMRLPCISRSMSSTRRCSTGPPTPRGRDAQLPQPEARLPRQKPGFGDALDLPDKTRWVCRLVAASFSLREPDAGESLRPPRSVRMLLRSYFAGVILETSLTIWSIALASSLPFSKAKLAFTVRSVYSNTVTSAF